MNGENVRQGVGFYGRSVTAAITRNTQQMHHAIRNPAAKACPARDLAGINSFI